MSTCLDLYLPHIFLRTHSSLSQINPDAELKSSVLDVLLVYISLALIFHVTHVNLMSLNEYGQSISSLDFQVMRFCS